MKTEARVVSRHGDSDLRQRTFRVIPLDDHFLYAASTTLGISKSELLRRMIYEARMNFVKAGLYTAPKDLRAVPLMIEHLAKLHLRDRHLPPRTPARRNSAREWARSTVPVSGTLHPTS
jgi:hypothetical protein